jgi:predicted helicase
MPKIPDVFAMLGNGKTFTKLDMSQALPAAVTGRGVPEIRTLSSTLSEGYSGITDFCSVYHPPPGIFQ